MRFHQQQIRGKRLDRAAGQLAPGAITGPRIVTSRLIVNVDLGKNVPALRSIVLEPVAASALATAAASDAPSEAW